MDLTNVQNEFILPEDGIYLNCANMSPLLKTVKEAGLNALSTRAAPWKIETRDWFENAEKLRALAAQILHTHADCIALVPSVSYGLAIAARNLKIERGKDILVLQDQYPSNYYVWKEMADRNGLYLKIVRRQDSVSITDSLDAAIDEGTGLVAIPNCHWMDGAVIDLRRINKRCKINGCALVLDLSQSMGALPVDLREIDPDFAVSVGYKWQLGPYALGYLYAASRHHTGEPLEYSWLTRANSNNFSALTAYTDLYKLGARRFDMGEYSQFHLLPMAIAALTQIITWGVPEIQSSISRLTSIINDFKKSRMPLSDQSNEVAHIIGIPITPYGNVDRIKKRLQRKKIMVSFRGKIIRVSPHVYNSTNDVDDFLDCFRE
jgi:selenocysteine lyase/cysteine desulfurase